MEIPCFPSFLACLGALVDLDFLVALHCPLKACS